MTIGFLIVCTGKYHVFLKPLLDSIDKYCFHGTEINIYLFSDTVYNIKTSNRMFLRYINVEHKPFPYPTLFRYKFFGSNANKMNCDYLFYLDVDMLIADEIGSEILPADSGSGLVATLHPGFYKGGGSWNNNPNSKAFIPEELRIKYYCGGFQGGETNAYLSACSVMAYNIDEDDKNNCRAEWHDESHWNKYLVGKDFKALSPSYCMPESERARIDYRINDLPVKIIALDKQHIEIRG